MPKRLPLLILCACLISRPAMAAQSPAAAQFHNAVRPILESFCFDCHADGARKGNIAFDEFKSDQVAVEDRELWSRALKMLRAGLMPPAKKPRPTDEQRRQIVGWIKREVLEIDPQHPDPGKVTVRRLNRVEYHNTIRDLLGVDFDTRAEFPPDDTGYGFDNIGDLLTLPPMLLEKYLAAANTIIARAVPAVGAVMREQTLPGKSFHGVESPAGVANRKHPEGLSLLYYASASVSNTFRAKFTGRYHLLVEAMANEKFVDNVSDYNKCQVRFSVDGRTLSEHEYSREAGRPYHYELEQNWEAGDHTLGFELQPLTPDEKQTRSLSFQIISVTVRGPTEREFWVKPPNYERFFPKPIPADVKQRRSYAHELLSKFATRAFRRPPDAKTIARLVSLAENVYTEGGKSFEAGVSQAMIAVLASPHFLFREEILDPSDEKETYPLIDEYSLASRLSYFLWSSMPDDELMRLAAEGHLRANLAEQLTRMLKDQRSQAFISNFTGQWLRGRDIESIPIEARFVLAREEKFDPDAERNRKRFRELRDKHDDQLTEEERQELEKIRSTFRRNQGRALRAELNGELRQAMRLETEKVFAYVLHEDRRLLELIDSDYTFLNERLAKHYGITNVTGEQMRLVKLAPDSPRGGVITEGTVLVATSNPTRTSPVKRGVFLLDSILGTPVPPPPANIPPLEDAAKTMTNHAPSLRETLAVHRENALCSSCHNRLDPLGLAFENFNALGMWRDSEYNQPIDSTGRLITGEEFSNVRELKQILVKNHAGDFYRTLTEKLLIYGLGRGLEYYDVETVDQIVARIQKAGGHPSALLSGIIESAPFQRTRKTTTLTASASGSAALASEVGK